MLLLDVLLIAPLVILAFLYRVRRTYKRRRIRIRMMTTIAVLGILPTLRLILAVIHNPAHWPGVVSGVAFGVVLSLIGVIGAKFEHDHTGLWHKPDPYTGSIFLVLIMGWLLYRVLHLGLFFMRGNLLTIPVAPPWGLFVPALVVGYWYTNYAGILRHVLSKMTKRHAHGSASAPRDQRVGSDQRTKTLPNE